MAAAFSHIRGGDTLVFWRLDRLGRTTHQLVNLLEQFEREGIRLRSLQDGIDPTSVMGKRPCSRSGPLSQKWNAICCGADESRLDLAEHCEGNHRPDCPIIDDLADLILEKPVSATLRDVA